MSDQSTMTGDLAPRHRQRGRLHAYFGTAGNSAVTLISLVVFALAAKAAISWLLVNAVFSGTPEDCKVASGACWPYLADKLRYMLFGIYPFDEQWRPLAATLLFIAAMAISGIPRLWGRSLIVGWIVLLPLLFVLMAGGVFGLTSVPTSQWGGLPLSFMLTFVGLVLALPLGILLALARLSNLPAIRILAVTFIELVRGVPLISILFMASVMLPLFMPEGVTIDKLLRAQVAIILFAAAYIAEIVRAGLQALPRGQTEAAQALGLHYWQYTFLVIIPQALKTVIPPLVSLFIGFFQDTTLVTIVGLLDFLNTVRTALRDPNWQGIAVLEGYLFAAVVYFVFSALMGAYSRFLEKRFRVGHD
ncbi:MAG TPA: amino acid ABC transporter permease [Mesorhizobium sp.]|jgi:general L-amino acid transport system permease protein|uniref:amino acid ABC transporter permease n=1 Tax=Mesorhizobium sp. TaxID=1871066 RepID=UPI002DDD6419|nr:amino acid ABC transporter permease [Mesorhizobium sp.]HEV2507765.1 amino acid ABC transporter permease [Mesorhizobium sp.]